MIHFDKPVYYMIGKISTFQDNFLLKIIATGNESLKDISSTR